MVDPTGKTDLLSVARHVLRDELLSEIPADKKYQALMVANAMAIAGREAALGRLDTPPPHYIASLLQLLGKQEPEPEIVALLIGDLRDGAFNANTERRKTLHRILLEEARRQLEISNPRYLGSDTSV
ncbi:MAG: hypothetical protein HQ483_15615 [Rhodospirillales bacterium]|nr:hypothetical protein [Rhodospirillales bacterium]